MNQYIESILQPWLQSPQEELGLPSTQKAFVVLDLYKVHRTSDVVGVLKETGFELVYIPGNCIAELQPLDVAVNSWLTPLRQVNL